MAWSVFRRREVVRHTLVASASPADRFAFKLFRELTQGNESSNVFFSPFSVMLCLLLVYDGSTGETREAIAKVLEIAGEQPAALQRSLQFLKSVLQVKDPGIDLIIANSLWCDDQLRVQPDFLARAQANYRAVVVSLSLCSLDAVGRINAWVAEKTNNKIRNLIDQLGPLSLLVAVNAIYFKGLWAAPFEKRLTRMEAFHAPGKQTPRVPFMHQEDTYPYYEERTFQAVRLPYRGRLLGMYVFLPTKKSSLAEFLRALNSGRWDHWMRCFENMKGTVVLPRFKVEHKLELTTILQNLGMAQAFDPQSARFDCIAPPPPPIWIDRVIHQALVEVDEEGTEAAAATAVLATGSSLAWSPGARVFQMIVERPFFFAIRDHRSGTILFMGSVNNPGVNPSAP